MTDIIQLIINNGLAIGVCVYFLYKDYTQSKARIDSDTALAQSLAVQSEVLRQLNETILSLKEDITKNV